MTVSVSWFNGEKTLIIYKFEGRWGWDDLYQAIDEAVVLLDSVSHRVDIMLDLTQSGSVPNLNANGLKYVANAPTTTHPNMGIFVMVGMKPFVRISFDIFSRIYPRATRQYRLANTLEDAISVVAKDRAVKSY
jgi:hypothetical protein